MASVVNRYDVQSAAKFRCRRCRFNLFTEVDLSQSHQARKECNSWYLDDGNIVPWIESLINESGWTEGKLYCPKCQARVGAFDFLHVIQCTCGGNVLPAIWCTKAKIDHMSNIPQHLHKPTGGRLKKTGSEDESCQYKDSEITKASQNCEPSSFSGQDYHGSSVHPFCSGYPNDDALYHGMQDRGFGRMSNRTILTETLPAREPKYAARRQTCSRITEGPSVELLQSQNHIHYGGSRRRMLHEYGCLCDHNSLSEEPQFYDWPPSSLLVNSRSCQHHALNMPAYGCDVPVTCTGRIHRDLSEIREEMAHLYSTVLDDADSLSDRKKRKKRHGRRSSRKQRLTNCCYPLHTKCCDGNSSSGNCACQRCSGRSSCDVCTLDEVGGQAERKVIPDEYLCAVCLELLVDPHTTPCDHTFCALCLKQLNEASRRRPTCPLCRTPVEDVRPNQELKQQLTSKFPSVYKKRHGEIRVLAQSRWPLPSPVTTRFNTHLQPGENDEQNGLIWFLQSIGFAIIITVITVVCGLFGDERNQRSLINLRNSSLFKVFKFLLLVIAACACISVALMIASIVYYAFDFVKFASFIVLSYVVIMKVMIAVISN